MKMELQAALATIAVVFYIASCASPVSAACTYVDSTTDRCRNADLKVNNVIYKKGSHGHIDLPYPQSEIYWYCGSSRERTGWGGVANRVYFSFSSEGAISWSFYRCRRCTTVERTYDRCRNKPSILVSVQTKTIYLDLYTIYKNTHNQVVKLPVMKNEVFWYCGWSRERTAWVPLANELSVSYFSDDRIEWEIKKCD